MSVGLLLITHHKIGKEILNTAAQTLGICPLRTKSLEIQAEDDPKPMIHRAREMVAELDSGSGVLILTDAYGSTPSNIAVSAVQSHSTRVVTGINLPMLLRIFNYHESSLDKLAEAAFEGGHNGIIKPVPRGLAG